MSFALRVLLVLSATAWMVLCVIVAILSFIESVRDPVSTPWWIPTTALGSAVFTAIVLHNATIEE